MPDSSRKGDINSCINNNYLLLDLRQTKHAKTLSSSNNDENYCTTHILDFRDDDCHHVISWSCNTSMYLVKLPAL